MKPEDVSTRRDLFECLDERNRDPSCRVRIDEAIWDRCGTEGAVLVTDLSGFTRSTRSKGILHFLAAFRRFSRACGPLINKHGGSLMKQDADDLIGVFARVEDAVAAAAEMFEAVEALNRDANDDDLIGLCIGIDSGRFLKLADDAFGDPVNVAFKLGEDVAKSGELLLTQRAHEEAKHLPSLPEGRDVRAEIGGVSVSYFAYQMDGRT